MTTPPEATMKMNLLPCPFCGGPGKHIPYSHDNHYIECCDRSCFGTTIEEAAERWNRRADLAQPAPTASSSLSAANAAGGMEKVLDALYACRQIMNTYTDLVTGAPPDPEVLSTRWKIDIAIPPAQSFAERERELQQAVDDALQLLEKSAHPFDSACMLLREAIRPQTKEGK